MWIFLETQYLRLFKALWASFWFIKKEQLFVLIIHISGFQWQVVKVSACIQRSVVAWTVIKRGGTVLLKHDGKEMICEGWMSEYWLLDGIEVGVMVLSSMVVHCEYLATFACPLWVKDSHVHSSKKCCLKVSRCVHVGKFGTPNVKKKVSRIMDFGHDFIPHECNKPLSPTQEQPDWYLSHSPAILHPYLAPHIILCHVTPCNFLTSSVTLYDFNQWLLWIQCHSLFQKNVL